MANRLDEFIKNARTETRTHNGVTVTVREALGIDRVDTQPVRRKLRRHLCSLEKIAFEDISDTDWQRVCAYADVVMRTIQVTGLDEYVQPSPDDPEETLYEAMIIWLMLPAGLIGFWDELFLEVNRPADRPEVKPVVEKSKSATKK